MSAASRSPPGGGSTVRCEADGRSAPVSAADTECGGSSKPLTARPRWRSSRRTWPNGPSPSRLERCLSHDAPDPTMLARRIHIPGMRTLDPRSLTQHVDGLYRAAWALCGSCEDAEDLVGETFARALSHPRGVRGEEELPYLMHALRKTFLTGRWAASRRSMSVATLENHVEDERPLQAGLVDPRGVLDDRRVAR